MRTGLSRLREVLVLLNREATPFVRWRLVWVLLLVAVSDSRNDELTGHRLVDGERANSTC
jgi:hypothetical protein